MAEQDDIEIEQSAPEVEDGLLKPGDVIGQLTLIGIAARSRSGVMWECSCSCGKTILRYRQNLKAARRRGTQSCCRVCFNRQLGALSTERFRLRRERRFVEMTRHLWEWAHSLYTERWDEVALHDIREASELAEPLDIPLGHSIDRDPPTWWPAYEDNAPGMTLEEIAAVMGITRERVRQIEAVALAKLQRAWRKEEATRDFHMQLDYVKKHRLVPLKDDEPTEVEMPPVEAPRKPPLLNAAPVVKKSKMGNPKWNRDALGIPEGCMLTKEAAAALGWTLGAFRIRTAGWSPVGYVKGWAGQPWPYWSGTQIEEVRAKYADKPPVSRGPRRPRRVIRLTEPPREPTVGMQALLVVKTKVSGIPMTIPVHVLQMAKMGDGNHQALIRFSNVTESILGSSIIVWCKDLLNKDYSPFKTPWDGEP